MKHGYKWWEDFWRWFKQEADEKYRNISSDWLEMKKQEFEELWKERQASSKLKEDQP